MDSDYENIKKKVAVVIPNYKIQLDQEELISLYQCRIILGAYDRFFILPKGIQADYLSDEKVIYVDPYHLSSRNMYSEFVLSYEFYDLFDGYDYVLIYQLDAFVFKDKLKYFCDLNYDYYGAKWPYGMECHIDNQQLWYYGNGGFSLRKVSAFKNWIRKKENEINDLKWIIPEDLIIACLSQGILTMVDDDCSYEFAFELNPEDSYKKTNNVLPFGCHGWSRFGRDFWKSYIEAFGYTVNYISQDDELSYLSEGKSRREKLLKYYDTQLLVKTLFELIPGFKGELYVFGAGVFGLSFLNMIKETGIKVCGIIDNDPYKIGRTIMGIKVIALSDIIGNIMHPIIIAVSNALPISEQLSLIGLKPRVDYITSKEIQEKMMLGKKNE